jgi:hypothetical protein
LNGISDINRKSNLMSEVSIFENEINSETSDMLLDTIEQLLYIGDSIYQKNKKLSPQFSGNLMNVVNSLLNSNSDKTTTNMSKVVGILKLFGDTETKKMSPGQLSKELIFENFRIKNEIFSPLFSVSKLTAKVNSVINVSTSLPRTSTDQFLNEYPAVVSYGSMALNDSSIKTSSFSIKSYLYKDNEFISDPVYIYLSNLPCLNDICKVKVTLQANIMKYSFFKH